MLLNDRIISAFLERLFDYHKNNELKCDMKTNKKKAWKLALSQVVAATEVVYRFKRFWQLERSGLGD